MSDVKKSASIFPVKFVIGRPGATVNKQPKTVIRVSKGCCIEKPKGGAK